MAGRLAGKIAIVTGGGTGIGAAIARRFAAEGAWVTLCGRRREPLVAVERAIIAAGGRARAVVADVADESAVDALVRAVHDETGRLDVLVNNAYQLAVGPVAELSTADWRHSFRVTLDAAFFGVRAALRVMQAQRSGAIVNVSSTAGLAGQASLAGYAAAKAALESLTRTAAIEAAPFGVRVNSVCPGVIATEGTLAAFADPRARTALQRTIPAGRFGLPDEVAAAALFLASDDAAFVHGATLVVDGGQTASLGAPPLGSDTDAR